MSAGLAALHLLEPHRAFTTAMVRDGGSGGSILTMRQSAAFLAIYLDASTMPWSTGKLAQHLGISAPGCCRTLDRLEELGFIARSESGLDRRLNVIERTKAGWEYAAKLAEMAVAGRAAA